MKNNFSRILGERLLTITEVSKATGISRSALTELYYKRTKRFDEKTISRLCDYLEIDMFELLDYKHKKKGG